MEDETCSYMLPIICISILIILTSVFAGLYANSEGADVADDKKNCIKNELKYWFVFYNGYITMTLCFIIMALMIYFMDVGSDGDE